MISKKIGLFFGSFNPVHVGHLVIANYMTAFTDLKEVWFVISPHNPFKQKETLLANHHRLNLVKIAIDDDRHLKACDIEFKLPQPSYTINTLTYLKEKYPHKQFALIIGSDCLDTFHKWKNHEQILSEHELYVYPRPQQLNIVKENTGFINHSRIKIVDAPIMEISSSFIREAIKNKKEIRYFLPEKVYEYIREMHFYEK